MAAIVLAGSPRIPVRYESWDAWRDEPWSYFAMQRFVEVMSEHVSDLRAELAAAGWEAAKVK